MESFRLERSSVEGLGKLRCPEQRQQFVVIRRRDIMNAAAAAAVAANDVNMSVFY